MAGFIQKFGRDTLKAPCLHATVLRAAVFHLKIVCSNRDCISSGVIGVQTDAH